MMDFLATNFNLPTIIGAVIVFGGTGLIVWHSHKHGGVGCDCGVLKDNQKETEIKKMQKSLQSSNGLPKKRQRLTQVRYIKA